MRVKSFTHVVEYLKNKNIPYVLDDYTTHNCSKINIYTLRAGIHSYNNVFDAFQILEDENQIWGVINTREILLFAWREPDKLTVKQVIDDNPSNYVTICNASYDRGRACSVTRIHGKLSDFYCDFDRDVATYYQDSTNLYIILKEGENNE